MTGYGYEANKILTEAAGDRRDWTRHDEGLLHLCVGADDEIERLRRRVTALEKVIFEEMHPADCHDAANAMLVEEILQCCGSRAA